MAPEIIVFSVGVGVLFVEGALNYLLQSSVCLKTKFVKCLKNRRKFKQSIVRRIGSHLVWVYAPRFHIVQRDSPSECSSICDEKSYCQCLDNQLEDLKGSKELESKVEEMEKEMITLREQVSKLLLAQENKIMEYAENAECRTVSLESTVSSSTSIAPPPPPMPPSLFTPRKTTLIVNLKTKPATSSNISYSSSSIVEELAKKPPKLRHVERSPGGRPVKQLFKTGQEPADILAMILKKRFDAIHSPPRDRYLVSPQESPSSPMAC